MFGLVHPVYDRNPYLFKVDVFIKQGNYEKNTVFFSLLRVFNMQDRHRGEQTLRREATQGLGGLHAVSSRLGS